MNSVLFFEICQLKTIYKHVCNYFQKDCQADNFEFFHFYSLFSCYSNLVDKTLFDQYLLTFVLNIVRYKIKIELPI